MEKIHILIVEDHTLFRTGLKLILSSQEDMEVIGETGSGKEALLLAADLKPRVILLDLTLDDMHALEIVPDFKKIDPAIKVLVLTMHDKEAYIRKTLENGGDGYLLKKAADIELISAIRAVNRNEIFLDPSLTRTVLKDLYNSYDRNSLDGPVPKGMLSKREKEVLGLVALGFTNKQIASKIMVSIKTVESHKSRIKEKLNIHNRSDLVKYAMDKGLMNNKNWDY